MLRNVFLVLGLVTVLTAVLAVAMLSGTGVSAQGTGWSTTVLAEIPWGYYVHYPYTDIALDQQGAAHVSYRTFDYGLGYATNRQGCWTNAEVYKSQASVARGQRLVERGQVCGLGLSQLLIGGSLFSGQPGRRHGDGLPCLRHLTSGCFDRRDVGVTQGVNRLVCRWRRHGLHRRVEDGQLIRIMEVLPCRSDILIFRSQRRMTQPLTLDSIAPAYAEVMKLLCGSDVDVLRWATGDAPRTTTPNS